MKKEILYHAAIYLRLSREDENMDGDHKTMSNSITSQRDLACSFVREQEDMELFDLYIDDGYSGTNFDRPDFKRMMADVEAGHVNCIIVKDLSRFGRDYIEAGRFIQKTFPAFSVRFIAITDHYDSLTADRNTASLVIPVKNFVNDSYCRDISGKVKSHQKVKREQGKFIGAFAVYGYCKDPKNKNKLIPDDYPAGIVKNIFTWKLDGMSNLAIANRLNELGVLSPLEYKKSHGANYKTGFQTKIVSQWSAVAVKRILTNEVYTGTMVQGRREKVNYKICKFVVKPESEWTKAADTHEAIISMDDYRQVQKLLQMDTRAEKGKTRAHLFSGLLFCGDCKKTMIRRVNKYHETEKGYYICSTKNRGEGCTRHSISETDLFVLVLKLLQMQMTIFSDGNQQFQHIQKLKVNWKELTNFNQEIEHLRSKQEKYPELQAGLYEDLKMNIITQADFKCFHAIYEKQYNETQAALLKQKKMMQTLFHNGAENAIRLEQMKKVMRLTELDRDALLTFIDRIEVYENKKIHITFRIQEHFQKVLLPEEVI